VQVLRDDRGGKHRSQVQAPQSALRRQPDGDTNREHVHPVQAQPEDQGDTPGRGVGRMEDDESQQQRADDQRPDQHDAQCVDTPPPGPEDSGRGERHELNRQRPVGPVEPVKLGDQPWIIVRLANRSTPVGTYQGAAVVGGPAGKPNMNPSGQHLRWPLRAQPRTA
jgi:hypothetical protein